jgi:hypothetical protein
MGLLDAVWNRIHGAVEWVRGVHAVLHAMAELERESSQRQDRPADFPELKATPPPRPRPIPAPPRVAGRKAVATAAKVSRAKKPRPPRGPAPGTKVKRGQKHR